jgi:hypothetical protein
VRSWLLATSAINSNFMGQNAGSAINASNANFGSSAGNIKQMHINQISWVT